MKYEVVFAMDTKAAYIVEGDDEYEAERHAIEMFTDDIALDYPIIDSVRLIEEQPDEANKKTMKYKVTISINQKSIYFIEADSAEKAELGAAADFLADITEEYPVVESVVLIEDQSDEVAA